DPLGDEDRRIGTTRWSPVVVEIGRRDGWSDLGGRGDVRHPAAAPSDRSGRAGRAGRRPPLDDGATERQATHAGDGQRGLADLDRDGDGPPEVPVVLVERILE